MSDGVEDEMNQSVEENILRSGIRKRTIIFICAFVAVLIAAVVLAIKIHPKGFGIFDEHDSVESVSVCFWFLTTLTCGLSCIFVAPSVAWRWCFVWLLVLSGLAALRELDIHEVLNPETLGDWGVRYRIDWWIAADTSILVRGLWALVALVLLFLLLYPLKQAKTLWRPIRGNVSFMILLPVALAGLATGYICDDVLREAQFISSNLKRAIEETSELFGAALMFCSMVALVGGVKKTSSDS
jgi:hypothetical protein